MDNVPATINFKVQFRAGKEHSNADTLSWLLPANGVMPVMELKLEGEVHVQTAQQTDEQLSSIIVAISNNTILPRKMAPGLKQCFLKDGMLCEHPPTWNTLSRAEPISLFFPPIFFQQFFFVKPIFCLKFIYFAQW